MFANELSCPPLGSSFKVRRIWNPTLKKIRKVIRMVEVKHIQEQKVDSYKESIIQFWQLTVYYYLPFLPVWIINWRDCCRIFCGWTWDEFYFHLEEWNGIHRVLQLRMGSWRWEKWVPSIKLNLVNGYGAMGDRKLLWRGDVGTKYEEAWEQWTTRVFKSTQGCSLRWSIKADGERFVDYIH